MPHKHIPSGLSPRTTKQLYDIRDLHFRTPVTDVRQRTECNLRGGSIIHRKRTINREEDVLAFPVSEMVRLVASVEKLGLLQRLQC
jgi:hypothetical protein